MLLAILLHGSVDGTATYMQVLGEKGVISETAATNSTQFDLLIACVVWAVLLTVVTRGRLSYQRYRDEAEQLDLDRQPRSSLLLGSGYGFEMPT